MERLRVGGGEFGTDGARVLADVWTANDPNGPFAPYFKDGKPPGACLPDPPRHVEPAELARTMASWDGRGGAQLGAPLVRRLPRRFVARFVPHASAPIAQLSKAARREASEALCALDLRITGTAGYAKAEVTEGGVDLAELRRGSLESRLAPGLHFCGEACDVTGRLGGFNFQWAWSSGTAAGRAAGTAGDAPD